MVGGVHPVAYLSTVDSTNTEAMRRIARGEQGPCWIVASAQTAGKGRSGRHWVSMPGNFYGSLILPLDVPRDRAAELSLIAGIAVVDALTQVAQATIPGLRLKWPNDVLVGTAKLAGILIESTTAASGQLVAVIGIGINLATPPEGLGRAVAALEMRGQPVDPVLLVAPLSHSLDHYLRLWDGGTAFEPIRAAWMARGGVRGEAISVNTGHGGMAGAYDGLDADGALLLRLSDGMTKRVTFGDVMIAGE